MEGEESRDVAVRIPNSLDEWLTAKTDALGVSHETLLVQLLAAYRLTDENAASDLKTALDQRDAVNSDQLASVEATLTQRLESEVGDVDEKLESLIGDVRARVIQVKKEADAKAPSDHTHPELSTVETLEQSVASLQDEVDQLATEVDREASTRTDEHTAFRDRIAELESKLQTVARVTLDMRKVVRTDAERAERERLLTTLREIAAEDGVRTAKCDACGAPIDVALLNDPTCPGCGHLFTDIEPGTWLIRSPRLVNTRPELEAGTDEETDLDVLAEVVGEVEVAPGGNNQ
ncbi:hypothetical protein [Haladaptatus sp. DJG-WS-42]|uniref:hypothetical protein n=1 Tax=Haladaptatus sp. DJG-WS-42 TaxID=3120516 RepID=UPI0030CF55EB